MNENYLDQLAKAVGSGGGFSLGDRVNQGVMTPYMKNRLMQEMMKRNVMSPIQRYGNPAGQQFAQAEQQ